MEEQKDQVEYLEKLSQLTEEEQKLRDIHLKKIANGEIYGPQMGFPEFDKSGLINFSDEAIMEDIPQMSIYDYIKECNKDRLEYVALSYYGQKITYKELLEKTEEAIKALKTMGINEYDGNGERDVVSVALPTLPETFYTFLAINALGAVANFIDPRINEERIEQCIVNAKTKLVISVDTFNDKFKNVTEKLGMSDKVVSVSPTDSLPFHLKLLYNLKVKTSKVANFTPWKKFIESGKKEKVDLSKVIYNSNDPAAVEYTSGTTGIPKGAILSNQDIVGVAYQEKSAFPDKKPGEKFLDIMPPFIAYGLVCGLCTTLTEGLELILIPKFEAKDFADLVMKHKPNHIIGVPSFFEDLVKNEKLQNQDLSFIKYCIAGGDKMNVESEKKINSFFEKHGIKNRIIKGYGMTELSSVVAVNIDNRCNELGSTGVVLHKNNIKVLDPETGERKHTNESGEIYISSPTRMVSYLNNESEMKNVFVEDEVGNVWVKTGDSGRVDEKGNVFIEDRYKNMIVRPDGHNVFPTPIENVVCAHEAVEACVVVGMDSKEYSNGQIPTACLVLKDGYQDNIDQIIEEINSLSLEKLPPRDIALAYKVIDGIPMTSVGKVDITSLKQKISELEEQEVKVR